MGVAYDGQSAAAFLYKTKCFLNEMAVEGTARCDNKSSSILKYHTDFLYLVTLHLIPIHDGRLHWKININVRVKGHDILYETWHCI